MCVYYKERLLRFTQHFLGVSRFRLQLSQLSPQNNPGICNTNSAQTSTNFDKRVLILYLFFLMQYVLQEYISDITLFAPGKCFEYIDKLDDDFIVLVP